MQTDKIFIITLGIAGAVFTYWFFLMKKDKAVDVEKLIKIKVEGGYTPTVISIPLGKPTTISFLRTDANSCLEEVVIPDFKIRKYLPLNEQVSLTITPVKSGTYEISCGMNMFHGKLIVK